eukprot:5270873-Amphidinium_carterae.1
MHNAGPHTFVRQVNNPSRRCGHPGAHSKKEGKGRSPAMPPGSREANPEGSQGVWLPQQVKNHTTLWPDMTVDDSNQKCLKPKDDGIDASGVPGVCAAAADAVVATSMC